MGTRVLGPAFVVALVASGSPATVGAVAVTATPRQVVGVTVDSTSHLGRTLRSLERLDRPVWTRLVLDINPAHPAAVGPYPAAARRLSEVSTVMGELADSSELKRITSRQLARRTSAALKAMRGAVSMWEIGNEVNGSWTGKPSAVARKVRRTYHVVNSAGQPTALTLYENHGCGDGRRELSPAAWARAHVSASVRAGLDEVLLSYYEAQCRGIRPTAAQWAERFGTLHRLFPNAKLGFGEVGMPHPATRATRSSARSIVRHYYRLRLSAADYVGGDFYWYYVEDMTPWHHSALWHTLARSINSP
jgi:hypothetical protein